MKLRVHSFVVPKEVLRVPERRLNLSLDKELINESLTFSLCFAVCLTSHRGEMRTGVEDKEEVVRGLVAVIVELGRCLVAVVGRKVLNLDCRVPHVRTIHTPDIVPEHLADVLLIINEIAENRFKV